MTKGYINYLWKILIPVGCISMIAEAIILNQLTIVGFSLFTMGMWAYSVDPEWMS